MINRKPKETITSWFSLSTFRWSCCLHVYLQMQITTKPSFAVMTTIYNLSNHDVMCYFWHEVNSELKSSNFASCIFGSSRVSGGWFCQHSDSVQRRVLKFLEKGHTWMEAESVHSATEGKLRGRQIIWPAEYIDVITAARRDHPYEVKQVDHTFFRDFSKLNYLSSIRPGSSAGDPQIVDLRCLQYLPDGSVSYKINYTDQWRPLPLTKTEKEKKLMTTQSPRCTRYPCASRAPSGSIFSSWRKHCPKTTITFMTHCLMETGYWTQEPRQFWFQGRHPWTSKEHAQQSKD